jgi:diacylglycerol kinase family enzyme
VHSARVAVVVNCHAGSVPAMDVIKRALETAGVTADVDAFPDKPRLQDWIHDIARRYDVIAAAGGDGTVALVAAAVAAAGKTLAVIPAGTRNHFARDAGIPTDLDGAVAVLAGGRVARFDIGVVNETIFLNNASIGSYPRMVRERQRAKERVRSTRVAAMVALLRTLFRLPHVTARLSVDGAGLVRRSPLFVVSNNEYQLAGFEMTRRCTLNGGRLALYVTPGIGRLRLLTLPARALFGHLDADPHVETFRASTITMHLTAARIDAAIDGEVHVLQTPLHFHIREATLRTLVPFDSRARAQGGPFDPAEA